MSLRQHVLPRGKNAGRTISLFAAVMQAFCVWHRIAWSAPWTEQDRPFR